MSVSTRRHVSQIVSEQPKLMDVQPGTRTARCIGRDAYDRQPFIWLRIPQRQLW